jgi:hypothetical protein
MWIRDAVFRALLGDLELRNLGLAEANLFPNFAPDSPAATLTRWWVLRWGVAETAPGRDTTARPIAMSLWAYDREKDFGNISATLRRARAVFLGLPGVRDPAGAGAFIGMEFSFSSEDLWDEAYQAVLRSETFRVVASGI